MAGRPKYIKRNSQHTNPQEYELYLRSHYQDILDQLNNFESKTKMFWVIDPWVEEHPEFEFSTYPTQWDQDCVHVFTDDNGVYRNIRLVPRGYEFDSLDQITNNSFPKLKEHNVVASVTPKWPVYELSDFSSTELKEFATENSIALVLYHRSKCKQFKSGTYF